MDQKLIDICKKIFKTNDVFETSSPGNLEAWDSLSHIQLLSDIEEKFKVNIPPDIGVEFNDIRSIDEWLKKNAGKSKNS